MTYKSIGNHVIHYVSVKTGKTFGLGFSITAYVFSNNTNIEVVIRLFNRMYRFGVFVYTKTQNFQKLESFWRKLSIKFKKLAVTKKIG